MSRNKVELLFTAKDLTGSALKGLQKGFGLVKSGVGSVANQLFSLKGLLAGLGVGAVAMTFVDAANTTEQLQTRLSVLLGSVGEGNRLFKEMTKFAGEVPFEYEEIMESATMLSGIMKGGVAEIKQWMPLIGDLAATTGLTIKETTEQVQRMLSAGAASADKFRERGVLSMLGFQAGVSYTANETKKMLVEAWDDPMSKFKGATDKLKSTWDGILSMISDKWFQLRTSIMDAGLMDYLKAIATVVDQYFGNALEKNAGQAEVWANIVINGIRYIMDALEFAVDAFWGLNIVWTSLKLVFSGFAETIVMLLYDIAEGFRLLANLIPGIDISPMEEFGNVLQSVHDQTKALEVELGALAASPMPGENISEFAGHVEQEFARIREASRLSRETLLTDTTTGQEQQMELLMEDVALRYGILDQSLLSEQERLQLQNEQELSDLATQHKNKTISEENYKKEKEKLEVAHLKRMQKYNQDHLKGAYGFGQAMRKQEYMSALTHGVEMLGQAKGLGGRMFKLWQAAALAKATVSLPSAIMSSYENAGGYPWGVAAALMMAAKGAVEIQNIRNANLGQAHAGLTNAPSDETIFIKRGERVIAPEQNRDLTAALASGGIGGGGGVNIETLNMQIDLTGQELLTMDETDLQELLVSRFIPALDVLSDQGIRQKDFSMGEQR